MYPGTQRVAMRRDGVVYFIHADHLGSSSLTTNQSGAPVAQTRYLPYGQEGWTAGTQPTDFTFTDQREESGFKLLDYQARYFARLGRFVSADTLVPSYANPQALNRYNYVFGNPVRYYDSDGHCFPFCAALAYGALRTLPRESLAFGSRQLAETGIPVVSDLAAWDANTTDQLWQAANGVDLQGNPLTTKERVDIGGQGYINLVGEAFTAVALVEGAGALWQLGKSAYESATTSPSPPRGASNPAVRNSLNTGNAIHYDQLNGGTGVGGPTQIQQRYPNTRFRFTHRGAKGPDVEVVGRPHPSQYPGSTWPAGSNSADFKPNTLSGARTFYQQLKTGKLPIDTIPIPYDPTTRQISTDYFFGP
jgi:RHS repeat-associated protein